MKKTFAVVLAAMMLIVAFSGCGKKAEEPTTSPTESVEPATTSEAPSEAPATEAPATSEAPAAPSASAAANG
ncbi:MAG: hypothetical protein QMB62_09825 [Oscillospiraceae bacterium]